MRRHLSRSFLRSRFFLRLGLRRKGRWESHKAIALGRNSTCKGLSREDKWVKTFCLVGGHVIEVAGEVTEGVAIDVNMEFSAHILR